MSASDISGELRQWHKVTLDFDGPQGAENQQTFTDLRLDVTFTNQDTGQTITVPGYFAADGKAAESGATDGNLWRAHFNPPSTGNWTYQATFREGNDVAVTLDKTAGSVLDGFGGSGSLNVLESDKSGADLRGKGMLEYDGDQYLNFAGDDSVFLKSGVGSPENFLAYEGFDNTIKDGESHDYAPHVQHFNAGDPTWNGGEGKGIIGAINYLADQGVNSAYMMMMNVGGDGRDVWPYAADDLDKIAKNAGTNDNSFNLTIDARSFDVSKLDQWEIVFDHMEKKGITLHLFFQETENDYLLNNGDLGLEKQLLIKEMVARFGHHNGIIWNLGEESTNSAGQIKAHSEYLKAVDPYDHPVTLHTYPGQHDRYEDHHGDDTLDALSFQTSGDNQVPDLDRYMDGAADAGRPVVSFLDEPGNASTGLAAEGDSGWQKNHENMRETLWKFYTEGGSGAEWYFGYQTQNGQGGDLKAEDFSTRESAYEWAAAARKFFEALPVEDMTDVEGLLSGQSGGDNVLAKEGEVYAVYLPNGGSADLDLSGHPGEYSVKWYNTITGDYVNGSVQTVDGGGKVNLGEAPSNKNGDWAVLVEAVDSSSAPPPQQPVDPVAQPDPEPEGNPMPEPSNPSKPAYGANAQGQFVVDVEDVAPGGAWKSTSKYSGFEGDNAYVWTGGNRYGNTKPSDNAADILSFDINVTDPGKYYLGLALGRTKDYYPNARHDEANDVYVRMDGGPWKKVFASGMPWEEANSRYGTTFDVNHNKSPAAYNLDEGVHTFEIAGRSKSTILDNFRLMQNRSDVTKDNLDFSPVVDAAAPNQPAPTPQPAPVDPVPQQPDDSNSGSGGNPTAPADISLKLYIADAQTNEIITEVQPGQPLDRAAIGDGPLTLVAVPQDGTVGSVKFAFDGQTQVENVAPYAAFGDQNGDLTGEKLANGDYAISVTAYQGQNGSGGKVGELDLNFSIEGQMAQQPGPVTPDPVDPPQPEPEPTPGNDAPSNPAVPLFPSDALINASNKDDIEIVFHFDGNNNDHDDIAALPMAAALIASAGLQDNTTFFFGNNLGEPNRSNQLGELRESADFAESLGIRTVDYQANIGAATNELASILNSGKQVISFEGGPMEAIYRGLEKTSPNNLDNITLVSHSSWNENRDLATRSDVSDVRTWSEIRQDFPAVEMIDIRDQNAGSNNDKGFNSHLWNWLDSTDDPILQEAREKMDNAGGNKANDPSDSGMLFYALTGIENADPLDARAFFDSYPPQSDGAYIPPNDPVADDGPDTPANDQPDPVDPAPTTPSDISLKLYIADAQTNEIITEVQPGQPLDRAAIGNGPLTLVAVPDSGNVGSVKFEFDGDTQLENFTPYALFGDKGGNFTGEKLANGDYSVAVTAYNGANGTGGIAGELDLDFSIESQAVSSPTPQPQPQPTPDPVEPEPQAPSDGNGGNNPSPSAPSSSMMTFYLADAQTNEILMEVEPGQNVDKSMLGDRSVTLVALPKDGQNGVESVELAYNGESRVENVEPYALFGDRDGDFLDGAIFGNGGHAVSVSVYGGKNGNGPMLEETVVDFTVTGAPQTPDAPQSQSLVKFYVADSLTNETLGEFEPGDVVNLSALEGKPTIYAVAADGVANIGSVQLSINGNTQTENFTPYALFGDIEGDFRDNKGFEEGEHTVTVSIFSGKNGTGQLLEQTEFGVEAISDPSSDSWNVDAQLAEMAELDMIDGGPGITPMGENLATSDLTDDYLDELGPLTTQDDDMRVI